MIAAFDSMIIFYSFSPSYVEQLRAMKFASRRLPATVRDLASQGHGVLN